MVLCWEVDLGDGALPHHWDKGERHLIMADRGGDDTFRLGRNADDAVQTRDLARPTGIARVNDATHVLERTSLFSRDRHLDE